jgi:hypothetical protein
VEEVANYPVLTERRSGELCPLTCTSLSLDGEYLSLKVHDLTYQKTIIFIFTAVMTSDFINFGTIG